MEEKKNMPIALTCHTATMFGKYKMLVCGGQTIVRRFTVTIFVKKYEKIIQYLYLFIILLVCRFVNSFRVLIESYRSEHSSMMSKETVGLRDHRYLHRECLIAVVLFNQMMDQQNPSS